MTQIALTVPLVVTCVVSFRHVRALETLDFGIDTEGLITARLDLPPFRYPDGAQQSEFYRQVEEAAVRPTHGWPWSTKRWSAGTGRTPIPWDGS
ncbi:MAG: hypothetical protein P8170_21790 [Gemmatimonadota bacterium]